MPYRSPPPVDLVVETELTPADCLAAAEYVARQARSFGIARRIDVRRSPSGVPDDRHQVTARQGVRVSWVMALELRQSSPTTTEVVLRLERGRRRPGGMVDADVARAYADLVGQALWAAGRPRRAVAGNLIPPHPDPLIGRLAS